MSGDTATGPANTPAKKRAATFMTWLGVAADITAVSALVFSKDLHVLVQIAAVSGLAIGAFVLLREWGRPVGVRVLLAMGCITAGFVIGALSFQAVGPLAPPTTSTTSVTGAAGNPATAFQFRLKPYTGVDFDAGKHDQSDVVDADGPNGNVDIFMDQFGYLQVNGGSFYSDITGPDSEIYTRCSKNLTSQRDPHPQILPTKDIRACFKTSSGKIGWLRSNDASFMGQTYAVIDVKIW